MVGKQPDKVRLVEPWACWSMEWQPGAPSTAAQEGDTGEGLISIGPELLSGSPHMSVDGLRRTLGNQGTLGV